jgi:hypothetical protein
VTPLQRLGWLSRVVAIFQRAYEPFKVRVTTGLHCMAGRVPGALQITRPDFAAAAVNPHAVAVAHLADLESFVREHPLPPARARMAQICSSARTPSIIFARCVPLSLHC